MSEHKRDTAFLRRCILHDESDARRELEEGIAQIERDARCVQRAVWLMALLSALAVAGLCYATIFSNNFQYDTSRIIINIVCVLGLASMICLVVFMGLGIVYRRKLDHRREHCRQLVTKLLESRLGKPDTMPMRDGRHNLVSQADGRSVRVARKVNDTPIKIESAATVEELKAANS